MSEHRIRLSYAQIIALRSLYGVGPCTDRAWVHPGRFLVFADEDRDALSKELSEASEIACGNAKLALANLSNKVLERAG